MKIFLVLNCLMLQGFPNVFIIVTLKNILMAYNEKGKKGKNKGKRENTRRKEKGKKGGISRTKIKDKLLKSIKNRTN